MDTMILDVSLTELLLSPALWTPGKQASAQRLAAHVARRPSYEDLSSKALCALCGGEKITRERRVKGTIRGLGTEGRLAGAIVHMVGLRELSLRRRGWRLVVVRASRSDDTLQM